MCRTSSFLEKDGLACWIFSTQGLALAKQIQYALATHPWVSPQGIPVTSCTLYAAKRLAGSACRPIEDLKQTFANAWPAHRAHLFIGACGIAVRTIAPFLVHKRIDPPVVVIDSTAHFVISLLSGHWGGGNRLTRHLADLLQATPVITTASDTQDAQALDLLLQEAKLTILDWDALPRLQGCLLDGKPLFLCDPAQALGGALQHAHIQRVETCSPAQDTIHVHWKKMPQIPQHMRVAIPCLVAGVGCRKNIPAKQLRDAFSVLCAKFHLEPKAFLALATIQEKAEEPAILTLAEDLALPLSLFSAQELASVPTENPSEFVGNIFHTAPFSVSEAAAKCWFIKQNKESILIVPKERFDKQCTFAVAIDARYALYDSKPS